MDIESEASKFDELVEKIGSLFCKFPYAKECRLAILGLSELEDLSEAMEDLTDTFGTDACDFALRVVQAKWRPNTFKNKTVEESIRIGCFKKEEEILDTLSLLYYNAKSFRGEFILDDEALPLSPIVQKAVSCTLQKNEQLKKRETKDIGFVSCLWISKLLSHPRVRELLDQFTFSGMFSKLLLGGYAFRYGGYTEHDDEDVSVEDIDRVLRILREGSVQVLQCSAGSVPVEFTRGLIDILRNGRIRKLHLDAVTWNDVDVSVRHLCTGLEAYKESIGTQKDGIGGPGLELVKLGEHAGLPKWGRGNLCGLAKALGGIPTLRHLDLHLSGKTTYAVLQTLSKDLLLHSQCKLEELNLGGRGIAAHDSDSSEATLTELCEAIAHCASIRALKISCTPLDLSKLSALFDHMASPGCRIEQFHVGRFGLENVFDDIAVVARSFENTNPNRSEPSRLRRISSHQVRALGMTKDESFRQYLQTNLTLLRDKLPYLISCDPGSYSSYRHHLPYDDDTPDHIIANADIIRQIGLWQERNQCGRALLLGTVAPTIYTGFWPTILEAVSKKTSIITEKGPPVDGIYYLVQGLVAGNLIRGDSWGSAEPTAQDPSDSVHREEEDSCPKRQRTS
mmetsp:Transcript_35433/g.85922  ORF Transcript_35433/g.85922 Transcript_35433/m.85922 type:complete len:623 (-) Transcript_35433:154-2022(-)